jgi:hypothetical protein
MQHLYTIACIIPGYTSAEHRQLREWLLSSTLDRWTTSHQVVGQGLAIRWFYWLRHSWIIDDASGVGIVQVLVL